MAIVLSLYSQSHGYKVHVEMCQMLAYIMYTGATASAENMPEQFLQTTIKNNYWDSIWIETLQVREK